MKKIDLEKLANYSLHHTDDICGETMLAKFATDNPSATNDEVDAMHLLIKDFINDAC